MKNTISHKHSVMPTISLTWYVCRDEVIHCFPVKDALILHDSHVISYPKLFLQEHRRTNAAQVSLMSGEDDNINDKNCFT